MCVVQALVCGSQVRTLSELGWFLTLGTAAQLFALVVVVVKLFMSPLQGGCSRVGTDSWMSSGVLSLCLGGGWCPSDSADSSVMRSPVQHWGGRCVPTWRLPKSWWCFCAGAGTELVHTGDTAAAIVAIMNMIFA